MKQLIPLIFLLSALMMGQEKVVIKTLVEKETGDGVEYKITVKGNDLRIEVEKDGREEVFTAKLDNEKAVQALAENLESKGIDIDLEELLDDDWSSKKKGYLGVGLSDLTDQLRTYFGVKGERGVLINSVTEDSPAKQAGLMAGDIVLKADDTDIKDSYALSRFVKGKKPETTISLTILRKGEQRKVTAVLGEMEFSWHHSPPMPHMKGLLKDFDDPSDIYLFRDGPGAKPEKRKKMLMKKMEKARDRNDDLRQEMKELREEMKKLRKELKDLKK